MKGVDALEGVWDGAIGAQQGGVGRCGSVQVVELVVVAPVVVVFVVVVSVIASASVPVAVWRGVFRGGEVVRVDGLLFRRGGGGELVRVLDGMVVEDGWVVGCAVCWLPVLLFRGGVQEGQRVVDSLSQEPHVRWLVRDLVGV